MATPDWQALIQEKRACRNSRIPSEWRLDEKITSQANPAAAISAFDLLDQTSLLTEREREITEKHDASALLSLLASGAISSLEVTTAFCKRAAIAQQLTNCLTEIFFDKAIERAKECDAYLAQFDKPIGAFHGLPISLKDVFMVKGEAATLGFVSYLPKPIAEDNSVIVDIILEAGAVLYCKTNVPQGLFVVEGENNVFGCTMNPHKLTLTAAGSSSGEGALVGFRGSPLGIGTDIGGSIRSPSLVNGCFGFKPTANRLPWSGQQYHFPKGWPGVVPSVGPLANSARDLTLFCKSIIADNAWKRDSTALVTPWRDVSKRKLTIGLWEGASDIPIFPPVSRALRKAADLLKAAGHEIKVVLAPDSAGPTQATTIFAHSMGLDTNNTFFNLLDNGDEKLLPALASMKQIFDQVPKCTLDDVWSFNSERSDFRDAWHKVWVKGDFDVLLCPGFRSTGVPHGSYGTPDYTLLWNLIDCPASVVPFLKADRRADTEQIDGYDADAVDGAPCHVQIVGWTGQDEDVLMATEVIADVLGN